VRRSRRHCVRAAVALGPGRRLILPFGMVPRILTERLLAFRPLAWCRSTPPSPSVQIVLAAVCRRARTPDGQNAGLPSLRPTLLVTIASGTLELPGVRRRSAASWPRIAWCRSTPSSRRAFRPGFSRQIWTCVGAVVRGRWLSTPGARGYPSRDRVGSIRDGGASCWCGLRLSKLIVCVFARRISQADSGDLGACKSCCDATTVAPRVWRAWEY
jgi:hypothetical protein